MTSNSPAPTLTDRQNEWDSSYIARKRACLRIVGIAVLVYAPFTVWLMFNSGWPFIVGALLVQIVGGSWLATWLNKGVFGPRPTQPLLDNSEPGPEEPTPPAA